MTASLPIDDPRCKHEFPLPGWMSPDQEDPCRCDLPTSHEGAHSCKHLRETGQPSPTGDASYPTLNDLQAEGRPDLSVQDET